MSLDRVVFDEPGGTAQTATDTKSPVLAMLRRKGSPRGAIVGKFYIMDKLADPMILGLPEMSSLGSWVEPPGEDGRRWVQFTALGIRLPIADERKLNCKTVKIEGHTEVEGPALHTVKAAITKAEYLDRVS